MTEPASFADAAALPAPVIAAGAGLVAVLVLFAGLWLVALRLRDASFVDAFWAFGMAAATLAAAAASPAPGSPLRTLVTGLVLIWAARLGGHLLFRWRREGEDRRYAALIRRGAEKHGWGFARTTLVWVFLPQAVLLWVVALPAQLVQGAAEGPIGPLALAGAALALFGILFEAIADAQLAQFRADPANAGAVMRRGLWAWSRHPNYFGETCAAWGIFLAAASAPAAWAGVIGPAFLTFTLLKWSGVPLLEAGMGGRRTGYDAYRAEVSAFIPRPPRKAG